MNYIINLKNNFVNSSILVKFSVISFTIGLPIYWWMANTTIGTAIIFLGLGLGILNNCAILWHQYVRPYQMGEILILGYKSQAIEFKNIWLWSTAAYAIMFCIFGHFNMAILQSIIGLQTIAILHRLPTEE